MNNKGIIKISPMGFPWETMDPFLFCAHHRDEYPRGNGNMGVKPEELTGRNLGNDFQKKDGFRMYHGTKIPGFPYHPHRGFETITINKEGYVDHSDSLGAIGRFGAGDVQWMTAGKGVQHSEMFPFLNDEKKNPLEIFQIWLNLPKSSKWIDPHFKMLWKEMIPKIKITDQNNKYVKIDLIAGEFNGSIAANPTPNSWAADPENGVMILTVELEPHAKWTLPQANKLDVNRAMYFYKGDSILIEGQKVTEYHSLHLDPNTEIVIENGNTMGYLLILQGKPINEPVAQYGPFVMNTHAEIKQTMEEFQKTQFGGWPWPDKEPVHDKNKRRFAKHADGREEVR